MPVYFRRGDGLEVSVLENYDETIKRLQADGWMRIEALTPTPANDPLAEGVPPAETEDEMRARLRAELLAEMEAEAAANAQAEADKAAEEEAARLTAEAEAAKGKGK